MFLSYRLKSVKKGRAEFLGLFQPKPRLENLFKVLFNFMWVWGFFLCVLNLSCSSPQSSSQPPLQVYVASSLCSVLEAFRSKHKTLNFEINCAGSHTLRIALQHGAQADLFISANRSHLEMLKTSHTLGEIRSFLRNRLVLVQPKSSAFKLTQLQDLVNVPRLIMGVDQVPIGQYTRSFLKSVARVQNDYFDQKVLKRVVSYEPNIGFIKLKLRMGEVDAGFIYASDLVDLKDSVIEIPLPSSLLPKVHAFLVPFLPPLSRSGSSLNESQRRQKRLHHLINRLYSSDFHSLWIQFGFSPPSLQSPQATQR